MNTRRIVCCLWILVVLCLCGMMVTGTALADSEVITVQGIAGEGGAPDPGDSEVAGQASGTVTDDTLDGTDDTDISAYVDGTADITLTLFRRQPVETGTTPPNETAVRYFDIYVDDISSTNEIVARFYYTKQQQVDVQESTITAYWWDGDSWEECSDQTLYPADIEGYAGYMEVTLDGTTSPALTQLEGTPFALAGLTRVQRTIYYMVQILPFVFAAIGILALLAIGFTEGFGVIGLIISAIVTLLAIIGVIVIQESVWGIFS